MNINTTDITQIIKLVAQDGLGFFALYIIYHYLGQLFTVVIILKIVNSIINTINSWVVSWFEIKKKPLDPKLTLTGGQIIQVSSKYQDKRVAGKLAKIVYLTFNDIRYHIKNHDPIRIKTVEEGKQDKDQYETDVPYEYIETVYNKKED